MSNFPKYEVTDCIFNGVGYGETVEEAFDVLYRILLENMENGNMSNLYIFELDVNTGERICEVDGDTLFDLID